MPASLPTAAKETLAHIVKDGSTLGAALLVVGDQALVSSQTVNLALGRHPRARTTPAAVRLQVSIGDSGTATHEGELARWSQPGRENIATLKLTTGVGQGAILDVQPVPLASGTEVSVYHAFASTSGHWSRYNVVSSRPDGAFKVRAIDTQSSGRPLVMGSPVWANQQLVGVVFVESASEGWLQVAPVQKLRNRLVKVEARKGTSHWTVQAVCRTALTALLSDLQNREADGIDQADCTVIKAALRELAGQLEQYSRVDRLGAPLHAVSQKVEEIYSRWNGAPRGPDGASARRDLLRELRAVRRPLTRDTSVLQKKLLDDHLNGDLDAVMGHFRDLTLTSKNEFHSTTNVVRMYFKVSN